MEHLVLPGSEEHFIIAPYQASKGHWYDGLDFHTYPHRQRWTEEQLRGGDDTSKDASHDPNGFHRKGKPKEVEQFFQTWLFFGLAIEVLKLGGVTVDTEEFLLPPDKSDARTVSTWTLPDRLLEWEENLKKRNDLDDVWTKLEKMFERAASVLTRFCPLLERQDRPPNLEHPRPWPVRDEIATTMIAMAFSLRRASGKVFSDQGAELFAPWPAARSEILAKRLQGKACIADVTTTLKELPIDGHYFLAASPGLDPRELDHHSKCIPAHCLYEAESYTTKHVTPHPESFPNCRESISYGGQLGPERGQKDWADAISKILNKPGVVPIALWVKGERKLWSVEYHFEGKRKPDYVAISHIWSDGKGNAKANALPECQLDKIQHLVERVTWPGRKEIPSNPNLSDGVGFWMDTLCLPAISGPAKKAAIRTMRHVYSHAKAVLVLDDGLQAISSRGPPLEIAARLYQSNWLKRLWTHQEGFLPPALWFQFSDRSVEVSELSSKLQDHKSWMNDMGIYLGFPDNMNIRLVQQYSFLRSAIQGLNEKTAWKAYRPLAATMCDRKTSRLSDETICLATILALDVDPFQSRNSPVEDDDEGTAILRMEHFVLTLGKFGSGTIFNNYERLYKPGYRWAPKSLLNLRTAEITYGSLQDDVTCEFKEVNRHLGLLVQYHGFRISFSQGTPSFAAVDRACAIHCNSSVTHLDGKWFIVELPPNNVRWATGQTYAVILSEIPKEHGQRCPAVVARSSSKACNDIWTVEHESIASVRVLDVAPPFIDQVDGTLRRRTTQWLIT